jgi:hypothetical protein
MGASALRLWKRYFVRKIQLSCFQRVSPASILDVSTGNCQRALVDETRMISNEAGTSTDQKWPRCKGRLVRPLHKDKGWVQISDEHGVVTNLNASWYSINGCKFCIHLRSLKFRHFEVVKNMGLKCFASKSPSMAWPPFWITQKFTSLFKSY